MEETFELGTWVRHDAIYPSSAMLVVNINTDGSYGCRFKESGRLRYDSFFHNELKLAETTESDIPKFYVGNWVKMKHYPTTLKMMVVQLIDTGGRISYGCRVFDDISVSYQEFFEAELVLFSEDENVFMGHKTVNTNSLNLKKLSDFDLAIKSQLANE